MFRFYPSYPRHRAFELEDKSIMVGTTCSKVLRHHNLVAGVTVVALLSGSMSAQVGTVLGEQKISSTQGGFGETLSLGDGFGFGIAYLGDLNGNGIPSIAVGEPGDGGPGQSPGAIWILELGTGGMVVTMQKIAPGEGGFVGPLTAINFGSDIACLGDLDGDGVVDVAVGAGQREGPDAPVTGEVWILFLNPDGTVKSESKIDDVSFGGTLETMTLFGTSVSELGDVDGDGVTDLAVGAFGDDDGGPNRGAVWIVFLNADGTVKSHSKISATQGGLSGDLDDLDEFGFAVAGIGDLDGDGAADLAVSAPGDDDGGPQHGATWILFLNPSGAVARKQKISDLEGNFGGLVHNFGYGMGSLGDLNRDGISDLAIGEINPDRVWMLFLNRNGTVLTYSRIAEGEGGFAGIVGQEGSFCRDISLLGDLDGDGNEDLVVGEFGDNEGATSMGAVWVLFLEGADAPATVWTGEASTDWNDVGNWTNGLPSATKHAFIPETPTGGVFPVSSTTVETLDLTIQESASVTINASGGLIVHGDLVLDGALTLTGTLDVDGSLTGSDTDATLTAGSGGPCVTVGRHVEFHGGIASACMFELNNPTTSDILVDVPSGFPGDLIINTLGSVTLVTSTLTVAGNLEILSGTLQTSQDATLLVGSTIVVESAGRLDARTREVSIPGTTQLTIRGELAAGPGGALRFEANPIQIQSGGSLELLGSPAGRARVLGVSILGPSDPGYGLIVMAGANLLAEHFRFEGMNASGVQVAELASLGAPPTDLRDGIFDNGASSGSMLAIARPTATELFDLRFENSNGLATNNVSFGGTAQIVMIEWSGAFGGPSFELDLGMIGLWGSTLGYFTVQERSTQNLLFWRTIREGDVATGMATVDFVVERAERSMGTFAPIASFMANGTGSGPQLYQHADTVVPGTAYRYKLSENLEGGFVNVLAEVETDGQPNPSRRPAGGIPPPVPLTAGPGVSGGLGAPPRSGSVPFIELEPGTYSSFSISGSTRLAPATNGRVVIDTSQELLRIQGLPAGRSVDLSELVLAGGLDHAPALVIEGCSGAVLLDGLQIHGSVLVSDSKSVLIQGCTLDGLSLEDGSSATLLTETVREIGLSGRSRLETWGLADKPTIEPGSQWIARDEACPWLELAERAPSEARVRVTAPAGSFWWVRSSDMLMDLIQGMGRGRGAHGIGGVIGHGGSSERVFYLPPGQSGTTLYLRVATFDPVRLTVGVSNVQALVQR